MTAGASKRSWIAGLVLFGVLSLTDFVQTYVLITGSDGVVYESNPVADAWLQEHGWGGLATFKLGAVAVFVGAAALLAVRRPRAGAGVLALGCAALLAVTVYSSRLIAGTESRETEQSLGVVNPDRSCPHPGQDGPRHRRTVPFPIPAGAE